MDAADESNEVGGNGGGGGGRDMVGGEMEFQQCGLLSKLSKVLKAGKEGGGGETIL